MTITGCIRTPGKNTKCRRDDTTVRIWLERRALNVPFN